MTKKLRLKNHLGPVHTTAISPASTTALQCRRMEILLFSMMPVHVNEKGAGASFGVV